MSILDEMKRNAVPAGIMRNAAQGTLPVAAAEMLAILVYLTQNPAYAPDAKRTLARWDTSSAIEALRSPAAPPEVLGYFWLEANRRIALMPALIENPAISENMLMELAANCNREIVSMFLGSSRARTSPAVVEALSINPVLTPQELQDLKSAPQSMVDVPSAVEEPGEPPEADAATEAAHQLWQQQHATEIAAEEGKPFAMIGDDEDEDSSEAQAESQVEEAGNPTLAPGQPSSGSEAIATAAAPVPAKAKEPLDEKKLSVLQKIAKMNASERVKAAFSGGREERMILIRDGARVVQNSVLASPKLTDPEVETFAAAKNVGENVLREIARTRKFMKNYNVVRNLVNNAKCPLDLSLTLIKNLLVHDLKSLRTNKSVPETIRQMAFKLYREKSGPSKEAKRNQ